MKRWIVKFTDGTDRWIDGYRVDLHDGVLRIRISHDTSYNDVWVSFPLVNVKSWEQA